jgi:hypothetical protein
VSAAAAVGFVAGMTFVGVGPDASSPAAADIPDRIGSVQGAVSSVDADLHLVEYGRPDRRGGTREFTGHLGYRGPEELDLALTETGPSRARVVGGGSAGDGDVHLTVDRDRWRLEAVRSCTPAPGRAACTGGAAPVVREVTGRAPFSEAAPIPLELVAPVDSFDLAAPPASLGERTVAGRRAVGVAATAGQVARFVEDLSPAGDLRALYPSDPVEMWLDRDDLVPLALVVRAADTPERQAWAAAQGYDDQPGRRVLTFNARAIRIDPKAGILDAAADSRGARRQAVAPVDGGSGEALVDDAGRRAALIEARATATRVGTAQLRRQAVSTAAAAAAARGAAGGLDRNRVDEGFRSGATTLVPTPDDLPDGFGPARSGVVAGAGRRVEVRSWTDGRAWVKAEATADWRAGHLFGDLGAAVRPVDLGGAGRGYVSVDGRKVALHGRRVDLVVSGSLPTAELLTVAEGLGVRGRAVPATWREAWATTLSAAVARSHRPLLAPAGLAGFGRPAVSALPDRTVTQAYGGPGDRGFMLTQAPTPVLPPPTEDTVGVEVRGRPGRYSPNQAQLEWTERGSSLSLSGPSLTLPDLLDIAADLTPR